MLKIHHNIPSYCTLVYYINNRLELFKKKQYVKLEKCISLFLFETAVTARLSKTINNWVYNCFNCI